MKWSETIRLTQPLRDVRPLTGVPPEGWDGFLRKREEIARQRGRREGEQALSAQLLEQRAEMAELQRGILDSLRRAVPQVVQETEGALLRLTLETAQKIVAGLPISQELVAGVVREAVSQVRDTAEITVQLHPDDLALLSRLDAGSLRGPPDAGPLRFVASQEITRGGCVVQTRFGLIDARRELKIEQARETLCG